jgi:hypothetical protein
VIVRPFITAGSFHPARNAPLRGAQNPPPMAQRGPNGGGSPHGRACRWVAQRSVEAASPHPGPPSPAGVTSISATARPRGRRGSAP